MIGDHTRSLVVALYAKTGQWCRTARLIWAEQKYPDGIAREAARERKRHTDSEGGPCDCAGCVYPTDTRTRDAEAIT